jgi:hypothetical protein
MLGDAKQDVPTVGKLHFPREDKYMKKSTTRVLSLLTAMFGATQLNGQVSQVNVTTWHNDNWRSGQNINEIHLTASINRNNFGRVCKVTLPSSPQQEQVYAQPLVVANSDGSMTVYLATMQDYVYAFSVPAPTTIWTSSTCDQVKNTVRKSQQLVASGEYPADACLIGNGTGAPDCTSRAICPSAGGPS